MPYWEIPKETQAAVDAISLPDAAYWKAQFWADSDAFRSFAAADRQGLRVLKLYQLVAEDTARWYAAQGIPEAVLRDSLRDVGIWCRDYLQANGCPGFAAWEWLALTLRGRLFRLGRLQFEPAVLPLPLGEYPAGTPVLEVHIPAEAPLDTAAVQESLAAAPGFFKRYFGTEYGLFHCYSWLLAPGLQQLLPADSRILRFQALFSLAAVEKDSRQAEERIFGTIQQDPAAYPEATSLQCAAKAFLCSGGRIGAGHGLRKICLRKI